MAGVIIGVDPHKLSATTEVVEKSGEMLGGGRFSTDKAGYTAMRAYVKSRPDRVWAVEGANGAGRPLAQRLVEAGEQVIDVPAWASCSICSRYSSWLSRGRDVDTAQELTGLRPETTARRRHSADSAMSGRSSSTLAVLEVWAKRAAHFRHNVCNAHLPDTERGKLDEFVVSTFGAAIWVDLRPDGPVSQVASGLMRLHGESGMHTPQDVVWVKVESDCVRLTTSSALEDDLAETIEAMIAPAAWARVAMAEDLDEFGARWTVLAKDAASPGIRVVHRRYILNADPSDPVEVNAALQDFVADGVLNDPRSDDVGGPEAATQAAEIFGVSPEQVVAAEAASDTAHEELGVVGGPFPWLDPLGLVWPGPEAGDEFVPDAAAGDESAAPTNGRDRRKGSGLTPSARRTWVRRSVVPLLVRPAHWATEDRTWQEANRGVIGYPTGWLLQGIALEKVRYGDYFKAHVYVQPLYVPATFPHITWSVHLSSATTGRGFDNPDSETGEDIAHDLARAFRSDGLPFLERVGRLEGFRDHVREYQAHALARGSFVRGEEVGYTEILLGNYEAAEDQLDQESVDQPDDAPWQTESRRRSARVRDLLPEHPDQARTQLQEWAAQTAAALRLPGATG